MSSSSAVMPVVAPAIAAAPAPARLRHLFDAHYDVVWRSLRRFGVAPAEVDDAAQEVFLVASRRLADIRPGAERGFLVGTAVRVAAEARRSAGRLREDGDAELEQVVIDAPDPGEILDRERARAVLDRVLAGLDADLRVIFVLFELEDMTMAEIAKALQLPPGTVASRLRRGREEFEARVRRLRASEERRA